MLYCRAQCECEYLCWQDPICTYYTWFDMDYPSNAFLCLLFEKCRLDDTCDKYCHSCPSPNPTGKRLNSKC